MSQRVSINFLAQEPLDWLSTTLGVEATSCKRLRGGGGNNYIWSLASDVSEQETETDVHFHRLFQILDRKWDILKHISETVDTPGFSIFIWVDENEDGPTLHLSSETIRRIAALRGEIDVDATFS